VPIRWYRALMTGQVRRVVVLMLVAGLLLLGLALTWHQVGMDHRDDMGLAGACLAVLAAALVVLFPGTTGRAGRPTRRVEFPLPVPALPPRPRCRPPPPLDGTVLLC
jgi:hypothetical protein